MKREDGRRSRAFLLWWIACATGCDDPLEKAQIIASLRVLGARVEVIGDADRATPAPGERAKVELFLASQQPAPLVGWTLSACRIQASNTGVATCASPAFATEASPLPAATAPSFEFEVPGELGSALATTLAVQGRVCEGVLAEGHGISANCTGGAPGTALSIEFAVQSAELQNRNPVFAEVPVLLDASPWSATLDTCSGQEIPKISAKSGLHTIALMASDFAREPLARSVDVAPSRESLQFSHFSDQVELDRAFSSVAADAEEARVLVTFQAPESLPNGEVLARFWFVLRDLRGGSAFLERSLCVVP